jgi:hypothetical protein
VAYRLKYSVDEKLTDSLSKATMLSSAISIGDQNTRNLALQSIVAESQQNLVAEQKESEFLVGKHLRKHG